MVARRRVAGLGVRIALVLTAAQALAACSGSGAGLDESGRPLDQIGTGELRAEFQSIQDRVFTPICTRCHAGAAAPEGMSLESGRSYAALVGVASNQVPGLQRVQPGDPDNSYLIHKISGTQAVGDRMPRGLPPLPAATIAVIRDWIAAGALPPVNEPPPPESSPYSVTAVTSNGAVAANVSDSRLVNPRGLAVEAGGALRIASQGAAVVLRLDGTGTAQGPAIAVPGAPTALLINDTADFLVRAGDAAAPAALILALDEGLLAAWSPAVDPARAITVFDGSAGGARYTGLAASPSVNGNFLYVADLANTRVEVFNAGFLRVTPPGAFVDAGLPAGYAPFGILALGNRIYVSYAARSATAPGEPRVGAGLGLINVFEPDGRLLQRLVSPGGVLDAPWGLALAPPGAGNYAGALLAGNFGDGRINAFDALSGRALGPLRDAGGMPITIPGLWGLAFGNGATGQPATTLFFTAGLNQQADGLYGRVDLGATPPDSFTPTVSLQAPSGVLSGVVSLAAEAADDTGVIEVRFLVDGLSIGAATSAPFRLDWDTTGTVNGLHRLEAQARDAAGNVGTSPALAVEVGNRTADTVPPTVSVVAPAGALSGGVTLSADAQDDSGVVQVEFFVDGSLIGTSIAAPFSVQWETTGVANGLHALSARARDAAGNAGVSEPLDVTVANATLTQVFDTVFGPICSVCHDGSDPEFLPGSMNLSTIQDSYDQIVNVPSLETPAIRRILPGDPDRSYLIQKVEGAVGIEGERMPQGCPDTEPCLDPATIELMRQWVRAGALNN